MFIVKFLNVSDLGYTKLNDPLDILKTEQNLEKPIFRCKMCVFETLDRSLYEKHIADENHQGNLGKEDVFCPYCDYKSKKPIWYIKIHIDSKHQDHGEKNYFCNMCDKSFIFECSYKKHDHIKEKKQAFKWCEICEIKVNSLTEHKNEVHETCSYCGVKIKTQKVFIASCKNKSQNSIYALILNIKYKFYKVLLFP